MATESMTSILPNKTNTRNGECDEHIANKTKISYLGNGEYDEHIAKDDKRAQEEKEQGP